MAFVNLGVQYFRELEFHFSINDNRWRRSFNSVWELVGGGGLEHGDVEDGVDAVHGVREAEGEGNGTDLS